MDHLAIMKQPWFSMVRNGTKLIESRCSIHKREPYAKVHRGDRIFFKESGVSLVYFFTSVGHVEYFTDLMVRQELTNHMEEIGIDSNYITTKADAKYLSLFWLGNVHEIDPIPFKQKGQLAWIVNYKPGEWM